MERKLTKLEHSRVEVLVTVDEASWKAAQKKAFDKQAANVTVDGFRKGKAPEHLIRAKIDQMRVMDDAINALLPQLYREVLEEEKLRPFAQPKVDVTKLSDTELEIKFIIITAPEVKLGAYKGLKVGHGSTEVSEDELKAAIDSLLKENSSLVVKEGEAKEGDTVVLDFAGSVDGKLFEGGSAQNYELELGSHSFVPGFEEQLIGAKAGEHVEVNVKFPENYVENLKGKDAVFACDVHEVKEKKLPELNDEFVKELNIKGVESVAQLKESKKNELKVNKENSEKREYINKLIEEIAKGSKVDIAEEIIEQQVESRKKDFEKRMAQSGLNLEQYLQLVGQTAEQFDEQLKNDSIKDITHFVVMEEIAKAEQIDITNEEVEFEYAKLAEQYNMKIEEVRKALAAQENEFKNNLLMNKIEYFLNDNNE